MQTLCNIDNTMKYLKMTWKNTNWSHMNMANVASEAFYNFVILIWWVFNSQFINFNSSICDRFHNARVVTYSILLYGMFNSHMYCGYLYLWFECWWSYLECRTLFDGLILLMEMIRMWLLFTLNAKWAVLVDSSCCEWLLF